MAGLEGMNNLYGMGNPYAMSSMTNPYASSMNDDFMAQAAFGNGINQQAAYNYGAPAVFQGAQGLQQPTTDSFEKQGSGSSLTSPLVVGLGVGGATAAGVYKFGTTEQIKDGKAPQNLLNILNKENVKNSQSSNFKNLYDTEAQKIYSQLGIKDSKEFEAIKKLSSVTKLEALPQEIKAQLPASIQTPADAKALVDLATPKLDKIDKELLTKRANALAKTGSLDFHQSVLKGLEARQAKVKALKTDATVEDLTKFFRANEQEFGIKGTEVQRAAQAEKLAQRFGTQENLLKHFTDRIDRKKARINEINLNLESQFKSHWDDTAKAFKKDAPEALTKAGKNFKLSKAGKYGAIAAAGTFILGALFGSNA